LRFNAEAKNHKQNVAMLLVYIITGAELALVLFGALPLMWKPVAMFLNGFPLGLTWGLIVTIVEGRESSDAMLIMLALAFVLGSGYAKDVGTQFNNEVNVPSYWMPAAVGAIFYPVFLFATWLLYQVPPPLESEELARGTRKAMYTNEREFFFFTQWPGLIALWIAFFFVVVVREYRDQYSGEILKALGEKADEFSTIENVVGLTVLLFTASVGFIKDNRLAVQAILGIMCLGSVVLLVTVFLGEEILKGRIFFICLGIGVYASYCSYNSILFERLIAYTHLENTTLAYPMVISDTVGYTAFFILSLVNASRDNEEPLKVIKTFGWVCGIVTIIAWILAAWYYFKAFQTDGVGRRTTGRKKGKRVDKATSKSSKPARA